MNSDKQLKARQMDSNSKAIIFYLVLTYIFNCLVGTAVNFLENDYLNSYQGYIYMLGPGLAGLIVNRMNHKPLSELGLKNSSLKYLIWGTVIPVFYSALSYYVYWKFISQNSFSELYYAKISLGAILVNIFFALGEEIGWRGFLTPAMTVKFGYLKASILIGLIWGLWHNPFTLEKNYVSGGALFFLISVILISFVMNYLRLCSKSVWPAVLVHAIHNYSALLFYRITFGTQEGYPALEPSKTIIYTQAFVVVIFLFLHRKKLKQCLQQLSYKM